MFPAFAHFRRTATQRHRAQRPDRSSEGDKVVMWYVSSNRDETRYEDPDRFDVTRNPEHQAFGAGGRHFCLGTALARLELRILLEETLKRFPEIEIAGDAAPTSSRRSSTSSRRCRSGSSDGLTGTGPSRCYARLSTSFVAGSSQASSAWSHGTIVVGTASGSSAPARRAR